MTPQSWPHYSLLRSEPREFAMLFTDKDNFLLDSKSEFKIIHAPLLHPLRTPAIQRDMLSRSNPQLQPLIQGWTCNSFWLHCRRWKARMMVVHTMAQILSINWWSSIVLLAMIRNQTFPWVLFQQLAGCQEIFQMTEVELKGSGNVCWN